MTMTLFCAPGTCSAVTMTALEEIGLEYQIELVRFMRQDHMSAEYRARNSLGKVPSLDIDGRNLHENVAIISWLNECYPEAQLLPPANDKIEKAEQIADLCFCASTLHPIVARIALPMIFGPDEALPDIRAKAEAAMRRFLLVIETRLAERDYWFGDRWSIMDAYIGWVHRRITGVGFDTGAFPLLNAMMVRQASYPSVMRVAAIEAEHGALLAHEGAAFTAQTAGAIVAKTSEISKI